MKVIAIANHKGGVGKSATTHAIADALVINGHRVLMIDNDPQASLTNAYGIEDAEGVSMAEVYGSVKDGTKTLRQIIQSKAGNVPHIAPADLEMAFTENGLIMRPNKEMILRSELDTVSENYDFVLIDCNPSGGIFTHNALAASNYVVIPSVPEIAPIRGIRLMIKTVDYIKKNFTKDLEILGVLPTMHDPRTVHHQLGFEALEAANLPLYPVSISRTVRVSEAMLNGQSIVTFEPSHKVAAQYKQAANHTANQS